MIAPPRMTVLAFALAAVVACAGDAERESADTGRGTAPTETGAGQSMGGMQGMGSDRMMVEMEAHLRTMKGASADSIRAMMTMHRQMVANLISQMNREMRAMNMTGDVEWTATLDSVRQDLVRLPELQGAELRDFAPGHQARVTRLIGMHRRMMGGGGG